MSDVGATRKGNSRRQFLITATTGLAAALVAPLVAGPAAAASRGAVPAPKGASYGLQVVRIGPGSYTLMPAS